MNEANIESSTAVDSAVVLSEVSITSELPSSPSRPSNTVDDETRRRKILSRLWGKGNKLSHKVRELDKSTISNSSDSSIHNDNDQQQLADHLSSYSSINDLKSSTEDSSNSISSSKPLAVVKPIMVVKSGLVLSSTIDRTRVNSEASSTTVTQINETTPTTITTTVPERQSSSSAKADRTSSKKKKSHQKDDSKKKKTSTRDKSKERDRSHHHNQTDESTNKKSSSSSKSHQREQEKEVSKNDHHKSFRHHSSSSTSLSHHRGKSPSNDIDRTDRRSSPPRTSRRDESSSSKRSPLSPVDHPRPSSSKHQRASHRRRSSVTPSPSPPARSRHSTTNRDRTQVKTSRSPKRDDRRIATASTASNRAPTESSSHSKSTNSNSPSDSLRPKAQASDENLTIASKSQEQSPDLPHLHSSSTSIKTEKSKLSTTTNNEDSDRRKASSSRHDRRSHGRHRSRSKEIKKDRKTVESTNTDETSMPKSKSTHEKSSTSVHDKSNNDTHRRKSSPDYHRFDQHDSPSRHDRRNDDHRHHHRHRVPSSRSYYPSTHYVHHHHHHHYRSPSPRYHHYRRQSITPRSHGHRSRYFSSSSSSSLSFSSRRRSPSRTSSSSSRSSSSYSSISRTSSSRSSSRHNHYYSHHHHRHEKKFRRSPTLEKLFLKASESIESVSTQKNPNASSSVHLLPLPTSTSTSEMQMVSPRNTLSEPNNFYAKSFSGFSAPPPPFLTQPPLHQRYLKEITTESSRSCHSILNEVQTVPSSNHDEPISTKPDLSANVRSGVNKPPRVSRFSDIVSSIPSEPVLNTNLPVHTPVNYSQIAENINCLPSSRRQQKRHNREVMECECTTSEYDRSRGIKACGHECLNRMLLIECGPMCPCGQLCTNRRFQRRSYASHKLALFKTELKGHGLRTIASIRKGRFLVEYVGEVIDMEELARRNKKYKRDGNIHQYVMSLIHGTVIDSTMKGNWARFINHSCEPNCVAEKWLVNGEYRMGIFAKRDLDANEEITIDYRFEASNSADLINEKCYCGAPTCRGTISVKSNNNNLNKRQNRRQPLDDDELLDYLRDDETNDYIIPKTIEEIRQLIQIMSRTDSENVRTIELDLLRNHSQKQLELPRLFLECNGLHVLCSWMKDILIDNDDDEQQQYSDEFKYHLLDFVHSVLPIKDRTTVIKNGLFDLVSKKLKLPSTTDEILFTDQEQIGHLMDSILNHLDNPIIAKLFHIYSSWMSLKERYIIPKRKEPEQLSDHHYHHHRHRSHHHSSKHPDEETTSRFHFSTRSSSIQQKSNDRSSGRRSFIVRDLPRTQEQQLSKDERRKLFEQQYEDEEKARAAAIAGSIDDSPGGQSEPPQKKQRTSDSNEPTLPSTPPQSQTTLHPHHMDQTYSIHQHLSQIPIDYIRSYLSSIGQSVFVADGLNEKDEPPPPPPPARPEDEHNLSRIIRLPPDWFVTVCSSDSSVYFYNRQTMSTSWTPPSLTSPTDESISIPHALDLSPLSSAHIIEQRRPHHPQHIYQEQLSSSSRSGVKPSKHLSRHSRSHRHHHHNLLMSSSSGNKRKRPSASVKEEVRHPSEEEISTVPSNEQIKQEFNGLKTEEQTEEMLTTASKELIDENPDIDMSTTVKESADVDDNDEEQASSNNNTLSSLSKINRDLLRKNISQHVHTTLKPYTKRTCKQGRLVSTDDIKYLVKKFTLAVLDKEIEKAKNEGSPLSPVLTDRVRLKTEVYVKKYMNKVGPVFQRHDGTVHPSSQTLLQTSEPITTTTE